MADAEQGPRWWVSWWQPESPVLGPLTPIPGLIDWWVSGHRDGEASICALVEAEDHWKAELVILDVWPEQKDKEWRFFEQKKPEWKPTSDRFPTASEEKDE